MNRALPWGGRSMIHGLLKIARHEGLTSLWRGTDAAVLMTVPLVAVYLPLYDHMLHSLTDSGALPGTLTLLSRCCLLGAHQGAGLGGGELGGGEVHQAAHFCSVQLMASASSVKQASR